MPASAAAVDVDEPRDVAGQVLLGVDPCSAAWKATPAGPAPAHGGLLLGRDPMLDPGEPAAALEAPLELLGVHPGKMVASRRAAAPCRRAATGRRGRPAPEVRGDARRRCGRGCPRGWPRWVLDRPSAGRRARGIRGDASRSRLRQDRRGTPLDHVGQAKPDAAACGREAQRHEPQPSPAHGQGRVGRARGRARAGGSSPSVALEDRTAPSAASASAAAAPRRRTGASPASARPPTAAAATGGSGRSRPGGCRGRGPCRAAPPGGPAARVGSGRRGRPGSTARPTARG